MKISVNSKPEMIREIAAEWAELVKGTQAAAFSHPGWYLAHLDAHEVSRLGIVCARSDGKLVGLLPLGQFRTDARGLYFPIAAPFARGDYQPPILSPEANLAALENMLDAASNHFRRPGTWWFPNIPVDNPSLGALRTYFADRRMPVFEETEVAPRLALHGRTFEEVEKAWTSSHRKDVRRQRKRLSEQGPVSLWTPSTIDEALATLDEFFHVHDEKWLSQGFPGMFQNPAVQKHYRSILQNLWGEGMFFTTLRCGDTNVSYHFGFKTGGWIQWYRPSYRTEYLGYSPGKIHVSMLAEEACREGLQGIDFLLGDEPYKHQWANEVGSVVSIWAGSSNLSPSFLWFSKGKPYFRKRFAVDLLRAKAWVQHAKRSLSRKQR